MPVLNLSAPLKILVHILCILSMLYGCAQSDELEFIGYSRAKRKWLGKRNEFLVSDLPIFQVVEGNYAAANFVGLRVRYARSLNFAFLNKFWAPHEAANFIDGLNDISDRKNLYVPYSRFNNTVLQNNEIGLHTSYVTRLHFKDLKVEADQSLKSTPTPNGNQFTQNETTGIEMNHTSNGGNYLENVVVRGYEVGERRSPKDRPLKRSNIQYRNCKTETVTWDVKDIRRYRR